MRAWLRTMAAVYLGPEARKLRKLEDMVLGSTERSSPLALRIPEQPEPAKHKLNAKGQPELSPWIAYLLGPGLTEKGEAVTTDYFEPRQTFRLKVGLRTPRSARTRTDHLAEKEKDEQFVTDLHQCALASLWLLLTYGGIGARTRRGFGQLAITEADQALPFDDSRVMKTPSGDQYSGLEELDFSGPATESQPALRRLCAHARGMHPDDLQTYDLTPYPVPPIPVLGPGHSVAGTGSAVSETVEEALAHTGRQLRFFRATEDANHSVNPNGPHIKTFRWTETVGAIRRSAREKQSDHPPP